MKKVTLGQKLKIWFVLWINTFTGNCRSLSRMTWRWKVIVWLRRCAWDFVFRTVELVCPTEVSFSASDHFVACNSDRLPPSQYLASVIVDWQRQVKAAEKTPGSPLLLIVCPAALRAAEMRRFLKAYEGWIVWKRAKYFQAQAGNFMCIFHTFNFVGWSKISKGRNARWPSCLQNTWRSEMVTFVCLC